MNEEFKQLSDREHLLLRSSMYIGVTSPEEHNRFIDGEYKAITFTPALIKILNELIDNSMDEFLRSNKKAATKIKISMDDNSFSISDNGRGIPVEKYQNKWRPEVAWTAARAGTSFGEERVGAGSHGIGSFATNVFSKRFIGKTYDGKNECVVDCMANCEIINTTVKKSTKATGTSVYCEPDFKRFGQLKFSDIDKMLIKSRLDTLALTYPEITFWFNDEKISISNKDFLKKFGEMNVSTNFEHGFIGILPSNGEYVQYSAIDGLEFIQGGTHESYISKMIANELKGLIRYKYRLDVTPGEIKSGMMLVLIGSEFPNMKFNSQTKEYLSNTESEVKKWLGEIDYNKIAKKLVDIEDFIEPIIANKLAKQRAIELRELAKQQKMANNNYLKIEKYTPATGRNKDENILFLTEGDCLEEHTKVLVFKKGKEVNPTEMRNELVDNKIIQAVPVEIKDIKVGDLVLTHNHNIRKVYNTTKKIKDGIRVNGVICSPEHKMLAYDIEKNKFEFIKVKDLDKTKHKLVKSNFFEESDGWENITHIDIVNEDRYSYHIYTTHNGYIECTGNHIFTKFNPDGSIEKVLASQLCVEDLIARKKQ